MKRFIYRNRPCIILLVVIFLILLGSCVPNNKIVYLQDRQAKERQYPRDSIIKAYHDQYRQYRLKENDIISIRIGSLTPSEYNFVRNYEVQLGLIRKLGQYESGVGVDNQSNLRFNQGLGGGNGTDREDLSTLFLDRQNTGFILDEFGQLEMPELGTVGLKDLTLDEAEEKIKSLLLENKLFETPIIRIQLLSFHFTVLGEVEKEGRFTTYDPETDLFDALVMAGNLTEFADRANIKIIRKVNGQSLVIYVNTLDQQYLAANTLYLYPDDMIIVPPLKARYWRQYVLPDARTALSILSAAISIFLLVETIRNK